MVKYPIMDFVINKRQTKFIKYLEVRVILYIKRGFEKTSLSCKKCWFPLDQNFLLVHDFNSDSQMCLK